jgi:hypothetical protein
MTSQEDEPGLYFLALSLVIMVAVFFLAKAMLGQRR